MATASLGLPESPLRKAFRAAEAILREDPVLSRAVKTWGAMRGQQDAGVYTMPTSTAMMPMVRLSPGHRDDRGVTGQQSDSTLTVVVELFVAGLDADDILDLWGAVTDAWVGTRAIRNTTVTCFLADQIGRPARFDVKVPGYDRYRSRSDESLVFQAGAGQIDITFLRAR